MQTLEVVREFSEDILARVLFVYRTAMPKNWTYEDADDFFRMALQNNRDNINIVLKEDGNVVGYALLIPQNEAVEQVAENDLEMEVDNNRLYIDTIEILEGYRGRRSFLQMVDFIIKEAAQRGINKFSMHVRVDNGLNRRVQMIFGKMVTQVRRIENWAFYNAEQPTEYLEITVEHWKA